MRGKAISVEILASFDKIWKAKDYYYQLVPEKDRVRGV